MTTWQYAQLLIRMTPVMGRATVDHYYLQATWLDPDGRGEELDRIDPIPDSVHNEDQLITHRWQLEFLNRLASDGWDLIHTRVPENNNYYPGSTYYTFKRLVP